MPQGPEDFVARAAGIDLALRHADRVIRPECYRSIHYSCRRRCQTCWTKVASH